MTLEEIRAKHPQYDQLPDQELADKLYSRYYSEKMPVEEFYSKIGFTPNASNQQQYGLQEEAQQPDFLTRQDRKLIPGAAADFGEGVSDLITGIPEFAVSTAKGAGQLAAQGVSNPKRLAQNAFGALAQYGANIGNAPSALGEYFQSRGADVNPKDFEIFPGLPREASAHVPGETFKNILRSIHFPKSGQFNYAEGLGREAPRFKEEAEADRFSQQFIPQALAATTNPAAMFANELGARRNPLGVTAIPAVNAGIGAAAKGISELPGTLKNAPKVAAEKIGYKPAEQIREKSAKTAKSTMDKIAHEDLAAHEKLAGEMYDSLIRDTQATGISKANIEKQHAKDFFKQSTQNESAAVTKAFKTNSLEDIHEAYKDLGGYIYEAKKNQGKTAPERAALEQAKEIRSNMKTALQEAFEKAHGEEGVLRFDEANKYWQENVVPNKQNTVLNKYRQGELTPQDAAIALSQNKKARAQLLEENKHIPELAGVLNDIEKLEKAAPNSAEAAQLAKDLKIHKRISGLPKQIRKYGWEALKAIGIFLK